MNTILYKKGRRIICYITEYNGVYSVKTGKPSDNCCLSWYYDNLKDAEFTAKEFFNNVTNLKI